MKTVITRSGLVKDINKFEPTKLIHFSIWNGYKKSLTPYGLKSIKWIQEHFGNSRIELFWNDNGNLRLVADK